ncbi:hypothetical protein [Alloyangia pacifica]|uniref:Uncharacterized protein n=1 Tax=Alloyangia pacifica TaxID=311180 RepID=A0A1I6VSN1_9RHOB|nr:hypothetical protein [Alloyangia pacifica]SDI13227.1 hypothetical protein SAMN04488245_112210 [Alloyangia pacifica]SFT16730.1 hypothetical protein SAMN04488050_112210 [Alloyangia pacifica]
MSTESEPADDDNAFRLFGFRIKRELDLLAFLAFIGSLSALGWQAWNALRGPEVSFAPITQTVFYFKEVGNSFGERGDVLYLAAVNTLYNLGAPGYGDFVSVQTATLSLGTCNVVFDAQNVVQLGKSGTDPELPTYRDDWGGVALEHGKASTRSIEYSALFKLREQELDCVKAERLLGYLVDVKEASVLFEAKTTNGTDLHYACHIKDLGGLAHELKTHRIGALACG